MVMEEVEEDFEEGMYGLDLIGMIDFIDKNSSRFSYLRLEIQTILDSFQKMRKNLTGLEIERLNKLSHKKVTLKYMKQRYKKGGLK